MNRLETERLFLDFYTDKDKSDFVKSFTDGAVMKYVDKGVLTIEQAEAFWEKLFKKLYPTGFKAWAVFTKKDSIYVGHAGIHQRPTKKEDWEIIYFLCRNAWGKGFRRALFARAEIRFFN